MGGSGLLGGGFLGRPWRRLARGQAQDRTLRLFPAGGPQTRRHGGGQEGRHHAFRRRRTVSPLRQRPARFPRRWLHGSPALPVRVNRGRDLLPRPARSRSPLPPGVFVSSSRNPRGLGGRAQHPARPAEGHARRAPACHQRHAPVPDRGHHRPGDLIRRKPPPCPHPHGHRRGQDLHRLRVHLSADQVRGRAPHPVSGRPLEPRQTGPRRVP